MPPCSFSRSHLSHCTSLFGHSHSLWYALLSNRCTQEDTRSRNMSRPAPSPAPRHTRGHLAVLAAQVAHGAHGFVEGALLRSHRFPAQLTRHLPVGALVQLVRLHTATHQIAHSHSADVESTTGADCVRTANCSASMVPPHRSGHGSTAASVDTRVWGRRAAPAGCRAASCCSSSTFSPRSFAASSSVFDSFCTVCGCVCWRGHTVSRQPRNRWGAARVPPPAQRELLQAHEIS